MRWSWLLLATALCGSAACTTGEATSRSSSAATLIDTLTIDTLTIDTLTERVVCLEVTIVAAHAVGGATCERGVEPRQTASPARTRGPVIIARSRFDSAVPEHASPEGADDDREA
jgi:hypothetical protein